MMMFLVLSSWLADVAPPTPLEILARDDAAALAALRAAHTTPYDFGMDLLYVHGLPAEASDWFARMAARPHDADHDAFLYGKAWVAYFRGDADTALLLADGLAQRAAPSVIGARAHYLIGLIHLRWGATDLATPALRRAMRLYQRLGKAGGVDLCRQELAQIAVQRGDTREARRLLLDIDVAQSAPAARTLFQARSLLIESMLQYRRQELGLATACCEKARALLRAADQRYPLAWTTMRLAFLKIVAGDVAAAAQLTAEVHEVAQAHGYERLVHFNGVVMALVFKAKHYHHDTLLARVRAYAARSGDQALRLFLEQALTFDPGQPLPLMPQDTPHDGA